MEVIKWKEIRPMFVEAYNGFALERMARHIFHYIEGERVMEIVIEPGLVNEVYLNKNSSWLSPHEGEVISIDRLGNLKDRVSQALDAMEVKFKFV